MSERFTGGEGAFWPKWQEWSEVLRWVYVTFSLLVLVTLAGSFLPYEGVLANGHPWLPSSHCAGCSFCGMTRSFCACSTGLWEEAYHWNPAGPFLYLAGWLWAAGSAFALFNSRHRWVRAFQRLEPAKELANCFPLLAKLGPRSKLPRSLGDQSPAPCASSKP